eukprot:4148338-Prymnesium_polylepis.1
MHAITDNGIMECATSAGTNKVLVLNAANLLRKAVAKQQSDLAEKNEALKALQNEAADSAAQLEQMRRSATRLCFAAAFTQHEDGMQKKFKAANDEKNRAIRQRAYDATREKDDAVREKVVAVREKDEEVAARAAAEHDAATLRNEKAAIEADKDAEVAVRAAAEDDAATLRDQKAAVEADMAELEAKLVASNQEAEASKKQVQEMKELQEGIAKTMHRFQLLCQNLG